jgi:hypothetical protein
MHKTAAVVTRRNKKMVAGAPVAPGTLTTKAQGAKSRDGREQEPIQKKYTFAHKIIGERAGDERSWRFTFFKKYILLRKSIYIFKKYTSEIRYILGVNPNKSIHSGVKFRHLVRVL